LICLDADDARLKRHFLPVMQAELFGESAAKTVEEHTAALQAMGYQTPISAREINLFYLTDTLRERIVKQGDVYEVLNSPLRFSEAEFRSETESNPERFSPNVVLRPLYQETILPNLAYVGGPSELPYWLQLKGVFEQYGVPFPMLLPRNFALYVPTATRKRIEKLGLDYEELFTNRTTLRKQYVARLTAHRLTMDTEKVQYAALFDTLVERIAAIDPTLVASAKAEQAKLYNRFDALEKRLQKAEERKYSTQLTQLDTVLEVLFPNGTPQERSTNFLEYYLDNRLFIAQLLETLDPLDFRFMILEA
jgi:bacillithiol biosynthesis cysteine-adding enzyme BshC